MSLHPHQHAALVAELREPRYRNKTADRVFDLVSQKNVLHRLGTTRFLTQAQYDATRVKPALYVIVSEETASAFPTGIPGFPNKMRRAWFDAAWAEVTNG